TTAIVASQYSLNLNGVSPGSLQQAIDGKIYLANAGTKSLSVINSPNNAGSAMNFSLNAVSISPNTCVFGLPNYINPYIKTVTPLVLTHTTSCLQVSFSAPSQTLIAACSSSQNVTSNLLWNFGDPASSTNT